MVFQVVQIDHFFIQGPLYHGHYSYWLINLVNDGHLVEYGKNDIFGQGG